MSSDAKRTTVLLALLGIVAVVVVVDRVASSEAADDTARTGSLYASEAALTAQTRAVAEARDDWQAASRAAADAWDARRARMIDAPSAEIAAARLRSLVQQVLLDEGISLTTSETLPSRSAGEGSEIAVIGIAFSFEALDSAPVYRVLDRIEHLPDAAAHVESISVRGPGRMGGANALSATVRLRAVAHLSGATNG